MLSSGLITPPVRWSAVAPLSEMACPTSCRRRFDRKIRLLLTESSSAKGESLVVGTMET